MQVAEKLKTVNIKCSPPRYTRAELIEKTNYGFKDKYRQQSEGIGRSMEDRKADRRLYAKNFARIQGLCIGCEYYVPDTERPGEHCSRAESECCVK